MSSYALNIVCTGKKEVIQKMFKNTFALLHLIYRSVSISFSVHKNPLSPFHFSLPRYQALNQLILFKSNKDALKHFNLLSFYYLLHFLLFCPFVSQVFLLHQPFPYFLPVSFSPSSLIPLLASFAPLGNIFTSMRLTTSGSFLKAPCIRKLLRESEEPSLSSEYNTHIYKTGIVIIHNP